MKRAIIRLLVCSLALVGVSIGESHSPQSAPRADLILHNGFVWTVNEKHPRAEAVAIRGEKIIAVGSNAEALRYRGPRTRVIDVKGAFVVPGFNDSHVHVASAGRFLEFNLMTVTSQKEFVARVQRLVKDLGPGEWITGGGWGAYDQWAPGSAGGEKRKPFTPDVRLVEEITRDHPLFIHKFDFSEFAANRAALKAVGLDPEHPSAPDVEFLRDERGRLTGILRGKGVMSLFRPKIPRRLSHRRRVRQTRRALAEIRQYGVTSISDMSDDEQLDIYRELRARGELTVRVHFRYGLERWKELAGRGIKVGSGDEWIRLGAVKGHIDGIMGTSTARFFQPYANDPTNRGRWRRLMVDERGRFVEGKFLNYMLNADRVGLQLSVHAIGDEANHVLLDYLEELIRRHGRRDRRFRLVHAQVIAPADFRRLGALNVIAEVQPYHLSDDMRWMEERIGHERSRGAYAFRTIQRSGAVLAFGSDWPGTTASAYPINPLFGLYAAVTRQTLTGQPPGGWFPAERLTIEEAITAYTLGSAYASFEEHLKGTIEVGKLADLTILSKNLLTVDPREYLTTEVLYTIVGGKVVYEKR